MNITRAVAGVLAAGAVALAVSACGPTTPAALPSVFTPPPTTFAPDPATAQAAPDNTGPLGTSYTVTTTDYTGDTEVYTVTLVKVDQHAALAPYETAAIPADHMAAARFTITGVSGQAHDDANNVAVAAGTDTTRYTASFSRVSDGPNFVAGGFEVGPGQTETGWVAFEVQPGVTLASVSWQPSPDSAGATWTLG